jgi:hypothetical protein
MAGAIIITFALSILHFWLIKRTWWPETGAVAEMKKMRNA